MCHPLEGRSKAIKEIPRASPEQIGYPFAIPLLQSLLTRPDSRRLAAEPIRTSPCKAVQRVVVVNRIYRQSGEGGSLCDPSATFGTLMRLSWTFEVVVAQESHGPRSEVSSLIQIGRGNDRVMLMMNSRRWPTILIPTYCQIAAVEHCNGSSAGPSLN